MWSARPEVQRVDEVLMNLQVGERHPDHNIITGRRWDHRTDLQAFLRFMILATLDHAVAHADVGLDILGMAGVSLQLFAKRGHENPQGGQLSGDVFGGRSCFALMRFSQKQYVTVGGGVVHARIKIQIGGGNVRSYR